METSVVLPIVESSQAGEARRIAIALARRLGFTETETGKVGIVVTEVANNLVRYAQDGVLLITSVEKNDRLGIEILALDKGPGIEDISQSLEDGFSTGGTLGQGLGAIQRLSDEFDIYSFPSGTAVLAIIWATPASREVAAIECDRTHLEYGVVCLAKPGEPVSGDAWAVHQDSDRSVILVADGLGHGVLAAQASSEAVRIFKQNITRSPKEIIEAAHAALRSTRGAVVAVAEINFSRQAVRFAGVGNISGSILSPQKSYNMVSHNGTVGQEVRKIQEFVYDWHESAILILHSDGLGTQWRLDRYLGLAHKHPSLIAGVLYRDFNRGRDDVAVLVARQEEKI